MVVLKHGDKLYSRVVETMTKHLQAIAKTLQSEQEGRFLEALHTKWLQHNKAVEILCDILKYMDKNYAKVVHVPPVHRIGRNLWRDQVMRSFQVCHFDPWILGIMRQTPPKVRDRFLDTIQDLHSKHSIRQLSDRLSDTVLQWQPMSYLLPPSHSLSAVLFHSPSQQLQYISPPSHLD